VNDELKFKAWDIGNKKMIDNALTLTSHDKQLITMNAKYFKQPTAFYRGCIWLQYTNKKDIQGVRICQGDILPSVYKRDGCPGLYEIVRSGGGLGLGIEWHGVHQQTNVTITIWDMTRLKILGNIYENPEILEAGAGS
jgi:hypothetical protein